MNMNNCESMSEKMYMNEWINNEFEWIYVNE